MDHNKLWKILKEMEIPDHLTYLLRICMQIKKQQLELDVEQLTCSKLGKEYDKVVYCHLAYLTYAEYIMQHARLMNPKLESRLLGEIYNVRYADSTTLMAQSEEELKSLLMRVKEDREKAGLKLNIQKTKIIASSLITSWQIEGEKVEAVTDILFLGSKITVDRDCNYEIKRSLLLGRKTVMNLDNLLKIRDIALPTKVHSQSYGFSSSHAQM